MSGVGTPGGRLALPLRPGGGGLKRRGVLRLALLASALLGPPVGADTNGPGGSAAAPGRRAASPAGATQAKPHRASAQRAKAQAHEARRAPEARPAPGRVVSPTHAEALFAQHSWLVLPPAPPPPPPPPPPAPTAPPFPYAFVGSYAPAGEAPVFFLSRGDRVVYARVGETLDGVYRFESAAGDQLVFVYLPLNIRQTVAAGASR